MNRNETAMKTLSDIAEAHFETTPPLMSPRDAMAEMLIQSWQKPPGEHYYPNMAPLYQQVVAAREEAIRLQTFITLSGVTTRV